MPMTTLAPKIAKPFASAFGMDPVWSGSAQSSDYGRVRCPACPADLISASGLYPDRLLKPLTDLHLGPWEHAPFRQNQHPVSAIAQGAKPGNAAIQLLMAQ